MKLVAATLLTVLLLTGCAANPAPTPTPTADPNARACEDFAEATIPLLNVFTGETDTTWDDELAKVDAIALRAEGDVKDRLMALIEEAPRAGDIFVSPEARKTVNDLIAAVERACDAAGTPIEANKFVTS